MDWPSFIAGMFLLPALMFVCYYIVPEISRLFRWVSQKLFNLFNRWAG